MRILHGLPSFPAELAPSVTALGAFDGIHLAHAKILRTTVERARALGVAALACTYEPHPAAVLHPERAPVPIATTEENLARMARAGLDATLVIPFTLEFSRIEAEDFVTEVLGRTLHAREVVVGYNHTFGRDARGTAALLQSLGAGHGFTAHVLPPLQVDGQTVSSSTIREALRDGDPARARVFLGHPYSISGPVLRGAGRGRTLGFPTANLATEPGLVAPPYGIYAGAVGGTRAAVSIGTNPHYGGQERRIEAFLLDFAADLYGKRLVLELWERLRDEAVFESERALVEQIGRDVERTRAAVRPA